MSPRGGSRGGGGGGGAAFSSCMCKYQAAALPHLDKSSYGGDVMLMRAKTGALASNPDDVVLSSRSLSQTRVYLLFFFATAVIPNFTVTTDQMALVLENRRRRRKTRRFPSEC